MFPDIATSKVTPLPPIRRGVTRERIEELREQLGDDIQPQDMVQPIVQAPSDEINNVQPQLIGRDNAYDDRQFTSNQTHETSNIFQKTEETLIQGAPVPIG